MQQRRKDGEHEAGDKAEPEYQPGDMVELTPQGRLFFRQLLDACSAEAGRPLTGEDLSAIMKELRAELGVEDLDFTQPDVVDAIRRRLRRLGSQ